MFSVLPSFFCCLASLAFASKAFNKGENLELGLSARQESKAMSCDINLSAPKRGVVPPDFPSFQPRSVPSDLARDRSWRNLSIFVGAASPPHNGFRESTSWTIKSFVEAKF